MEFVNFMQSPIGRALRVLVGLLLVMSGLFWTGGIWGLLLAVIGVVLIAVGIFRLCLLAPVFGFSMDQHA
jgi:hypothetical protein